MQKREPEMPFDPLLAQCYMAELTHRAQEPEMIAALLLVSAQMIGSTALQGDQAYEQQLNRFCKEARLARSRARVALQAQDLINRAKEGKNAT